MGDVSKGEGRTVLFVSHNMASVQNLCDRGILLDKGLIIENGKIDNVVAKYFGEIKRKIEWTGLIMSMGLRILQTSIYNDDNEDLQFTDKPLFIKISIDITENINELGIGFIIKSKYDEALVRCFYNDYNDLLTLPKGKHSIIFKIPPFTLAAGSYTIDFDISIAKIKKVSNEECNLSFDLISRTIIGNRYEGDTVKTFGSIVRPNWLETIN